MWISFGKVHKNPTTTDVKKRAIKVIDYVDNKIEDVDNRIKTTMN